MIDVGIAIAAINVERKLHRNRKTTIDARIEPTIRCSSIACSEFSIKIELSPMIRISKPFGRVGCDLLEPVLDLARDGDGVLPRLF